MKWILGLATAVAVAALALVATPGAHAQDATVTVGDNFYDPAAVTISVGDTVTWNWSGSLPHTVTATDGSFDSAQQTSGTFSQTFDTAGTFSYFCEVHGTAMSGSVTVAAAAGEQPTAPAAASPTAAAAAPTTAAGVATPTAATGAGTAVAAPSTGTGGASEGGATATSIVIGTLAAGGLLVALGAVASRKRA